ncbi:O-methyltransferase [Arenimonas caeni]|uniref:O-methyltransferase n=1 Tax=Arenimonas caeni TaxID=2058085 RepID=UPI0013B051AC|nr:O-methyltransferase [Arenimonas caeni]
MSGSSLPYKLRPNKAVDRELFLSLLMRLAPKLGLEKYHYVSLGGPFLEDFRLVHSRVGIGRKRNGRTVGRLTCVESELEIHKRQKFNRPLAAIRCVHSTLEKFLDQTTFATPAIIWFDYTAPKDIASQIQRFAATVGTVPVGSVLRVTLNGNPTSLGSGGEEPSGKDLSVEVDGEVSSDRAQKPTKAEWRLEEFRQRLGALVPAGIAPEAMTHKKYGPTLLGVLKLSVDKQALSFSDRQVVWALATHYADEQPMVTAALVVAPKGDSDLEKLVRGWEFFSKPEDPHRVELPALSSLERLTLESSSYAHRRLGFDLAKVVDSKLGTDPVDSFRKFYRLYPHFSRVDL